VTGNLVEGKLIKGKHPVIIDLKTFLKANQLLKAEPTAGITKMHKITALPLKIFAKTDVLRSPFTGYIKKGHWYYKARGKQEKVNISAVKLNDHFTDYLSQFEYDKAYRESLAKALESKVKAILLKHCRKVYH